MCGFFFELGHLANACAFTNQQQFPIVRNVFGAFCPSIDNHISIINIAGSSDIWNTTSC
jgi:hypothetical protein